MKYQTRIVLATLAGFCTLHTGCGGASSTPRTETTPIGTAKDPAASAGSSNVPSTGANPNTVADPIGAATTVLTPNSPLLRYMGRFTPSNAAGVQFAWPGSAIAVSFVGPRLVMHMTEAAQAYYSGTPVDNYFDISIDNQPATKLALNHTAQSYVIADNLAAGTHTVWVRKRTEASIGTALFAGFELTQGGQFSTPPAPSARGMEFIGDSGLTGYGADMDLTAGNLCHFTDATENADYSYAKFTADMFGADLMNISYSGKGMTRNIVDADNVRMLPLIYDRTLPDDDTSTYDFTNWAAQVVVIDAGGNDLVGDPGAGTPPTQAAFNAAYLSLIKKVRSHHPTAAIFLVVTTSAFSQDRITLRTYVNGVVTAAQAGGDAQVYFFEFPEYDGGTYGFGCDSHPDQPGAQHNASLLSAAIKAQVPW